jgi:hypothetical protein
MEDYEPQPFQKKRQPEEIDAERAICSALPQNSDRLKTT